MFGSLGLFGGLGADTGGGDGVPSTVREAIHYLLIDDPEIHAAIDDRIHPGGIPQDPQYPCLSWAIAGRSEDQDFDGATDLAVIRLRVSSWSPWLAEAEFLAAKVRAALILPSPLQVGDVRLEHAELENEFDLPEKPETGREEYLHQVITEYRLWFRANP